MANMALSCCARMKNGIKILKATGNFSRVGAKMQANYCVSASSSQTYPGITESTEEYKYVERLIPPSSVPTPPKHDQYPTPSGWRPPAAVPPALPYMVRRSRMHNVPVYSDITHGNRKMTIVRKIEGDIWALEKDLKDFLTHTSGTTPLMQVNEVNMSIRIKGSFDKDLKSWLLEKGF
ncbi:mitochondrial ribosomal protein L49 [Polypterus senegalus]|nr:mitochondrial ribosomal protein L49 [Polypterus senegalus]